MVSLSRELNSPTRGGVFFNDASLSSREDDLLTQRILTNDEHKEFQILNTVIVAVFHLSVVIGILILAVLLVFMWPADKEECQSYFILQYVHAAFWCITFIVHHYLKAKHHTLRVNGYLEFYKETYNHSRLPFYIVSLWNMVMLVIGTVFHQLHITFEEQCQSGGLLSPDKCLCIIIAVEIVLLTPLIITYIRKVYQFNRGQPLPDVQREEWMSNFIQDSYSGGEVGYRENGAFLSDLLEKQADVIRYLKERNVQLGRRIMVLHSQVRSVRT
ncbi:transmembrane protein 192 [Anabrus simplex]|uniref:transmembrane protein 192 n=1 Tax=Anabrus simplex TaxID=316456 RepID=UPI0034DCE773